MNKLLKVSIFILFATSSIFYLFEFIALGLRLAFVDELVRRHINSANIRKQNVQLEKYFKDEEHYDSKTAREFIEDYKTKNKGYELQPFIPSIEYYKLSNYKILPLGGVPNQFIINRNENGYWPIIKNDKFGFNNENSAWDDSNIVISGPSTVWGSGVHSGQNFARILRDHYGYKILNLGYPQLPYPEAYYALILEYFKLINPDYFIWTISDENAGDENLFLLKDFLTRKYGKFYNQNLLEKTDEIISLHKNYMELYYNKSYIISRDINFKDVPKEFLRLINLRTIKEYIRNEINPVKVKHNYNELLTKKECKVGRVKRELQKLEKIDQYLNPDTQIIVLFLTTKNRLNFKNSKNDFCFDSLQNEIEKKGYPIIDLTQIINSKKIISKKIFNENGNLHFSKEGNILIAKILSEQLMKLYAKENY